MKCFTVEHILVSFIASLTLATGLAQLLLPAQMLEQMGTRVSSPLERQQLSTIGLFMALFGTALLHALRRPHVLPVLLFWSALQKAGFALLLSVGLLRDIYAPAILPIVVFDLAAALIFLDFRRRCLSAGS